MAGTEPKKRPMEAYFTKRLAEERALAERAVDPREREAHLRACRLFQELIAGKDWGIFTRA